MRFLRKHPGGELKRHTDTVSPPNVLVGGLVRIRLDSLKACGNDGVAHSQAKRHMELSHGLYLTAF